MPNQPRTQHRSVRIGDEDWADLDAATAVEGTDRAKVINQMVRWYLRRPGAKLPPRPEAQRDSGSAGELPAACSAPVPPDFVMRREST